MTHNVLGENGLRRSTFTRMQSFLWAAFLITAFAFVSSLLTDARADDAPDKSRGCSSTAYGGHDYVVCRFDPAADDIRLFLNDAAGQPYGHFNFIKDALAAKGETLAFAMNAGMYHEDRAPVGLYVEDGKTLKKLNAKDGPGNFHLKPNGVFFIAEDGAAGVAETAAFRAKDPKVRYATQSGPMLVVNGKIHPRFLPDSDSLKRRNGVGVDETGAVFFVLADAPVRFHDFAAFFRDGLKTPNALYLDGTISRLYAPEIGRNDPGAAMGPVIGVVAPAN